MPKKKEKNLNKLKNIIMASFQGNIFWKRPKKRETKNYRYVPLLPDALYKNSKKIAIKFIENTKIPLWLHFKPKSVERG